MGCGAPVRGAFARVADGGWAVAGCVPGARVRRVTPPVVVGGRWVEVPAIGRARRSFVLVLDDGDDVFDLMNGEWW